MHFVGRSADFKMSVLYPYAGHSSGYTQASLVNHSTGSVHTGLSLNQLAAGGTLDEHVHSYEEGFYILEGQALVSIARQDYLLVPGDYAAIKVGTAHAWRNAGQQPVRWLGMAAPQPKPEGGVRDTFFVKNGRIPTEGARLDLNDRKGNLLGHFDASQIPKPGESRAVVTGAPGVFLQWLIDSNFGARHHRMIFIEYLPEVGIPLHDHTFEEAYFVLSGEIEAVLDGKSYLAKPGDVLWTGVGCVHTFNNVSKEPVRWLETFAPQPPAEDVFRFSAEWEKRAKEIEG